MPEKPKPRPQKTELKTAVEIVGYPMDNMEQLIEYCMQQSKKEYPGKEAIDKSVILLAKKDAENYRRLEEASEGKLGTKYKLWPELNDKERNLAEEMYVKKLNELSAKFEEDVRGLEQRCKLISGGRRKWLFNEWKADLMEGMAAELDGYMNRLVNAVDAVDAKSEEAVLAALESEEQAEEKTKLAGGEDIAGYVAKATYTGVEALGKPEEFRRKREKKHGL